MWYFSGRQHISIMKQIVVVLCLMSTQMVKSEKTQSDPMCMNETGVTEEAIAKGKAVLSHDYLCYRVCLLKKHNIMTSENKMDVEYLKKKYSLTDRPIPVQIQRIITYAGICNRLVILDADACIALNQTLKCISVINIEMNKSKSIKQVCMDETGTTEEQFKAYSKPGVVRSRGFLCFIVCIFKHIDYWKSGNQMEVEKVLHRLNTTDTPRYMKLIKIGKECNGQAKPDEDSCIAFNQTVNCIKQKDEYGFDILSN